MEEPPAVRFELLTFCIGMYLCVQLTDFSVLKKQCVSFRLSSDLKAIVWFKMKPVGLKGVRVCVPKSPVRLEAQPCSLGQSRRKVRFKDEGPFSLTIGNGDYFWTNKDMLWNYVQTLSGKNSAVTNNLGFKNLTTKITPMPYRKLEK